ncbi:octopamine receptor Oamb-like [Actinia tenebrosa]|uniref:Octopamine receptor Oamb-like n=1 Tax=Actinia tenebrosa TaxID=6105 RepID=A0A6P8ILP0_ACTTE|nr:octopamine receptor Oamb-like [Actinia tenebrosa]
MEKTEDNFNSSSCVNFSVMHPEMSKRELCAVTAFYVVLMIGIVIGNGLIFAAFFVNHKLRTTTNKLILGLALSDILVGIISVPLWIFISVKSAQGEYYSDGLYQFYITFDIFVGSASILQLTSISIERCHAIVRPLRHRTLPKKTFRTLLLTPWVISSLVASLQPLQYRRWQEVYTLLMVTTCFLVPFSVIMLAYIFIFMFARVKRPSQRLLRNTTRSRAYRKEIRLSVTIAFITLLFVIAWLPLFVLTIVATYYPSSLPSMITTDRLLKFAKWMHYSNSSINPFLYAFRNNAIRRTFQYLISKLLCGRFSPRIGQRRIKLQSMPFRSSANRSDFSHR